MIKYFKEIYENRHTHAKDWKKKHPGAKILGYMCTYMPEEILYAAGVLPVRLLGSHEPQNVTEPHIMGMFCPFCRDVLAQGLLGHYDYLDGVGVTHSCQHITQSYESWVLHKDVKDFFIPTPNNMQTPHSLPYQRGQFKVFKDQVEEWTGKKISDDDLRRGIEIVDRTRRLMREIYEMRKSDNPPISAIDAMYMVVASQIADKEKFNEILEDVLKKELPGRKVKDDPGIRLMMIGSENDDVKFVEMVEQLDASIVVDDHCTGGRYFWNTTEGAGDPLTLIADRYIKRPPCPIKDFPARNRIPHLIGLAEDWNVAGVIIIQQKFCDPHELDKVAITDALNKAGSAPGSSEKSSTCSSFKCGAYHQLVLSENGFHRNDLDPYLLPIPQV
ncbi:MAG: 2-hydroxyacyl-CoA dehydratase [Thermodesulfobacteriota bacterium]|nr:2-hydroxyacyl-CoA dehydratase [Thermodesulfobacteriota bacterium]